MLLDPKLLHSMPKLHGAHQKLAAHWSEDTATCWARLERVDEAYFLLEAEFRESSWHVWGYQKLHRYVFAVPFTGQLDKLEAEGWKWDKTFTPKLWPLVKAKAFVNPPRVTETKAPNIGRRTASRR